MRAIMNQTEFNLIIKTLEQTASQLLKNSELQVPLDSNEFMKVRDFQLDEDSILNEEIIEMMEGNNILDVLYFIARKRVLSICMNISKDDEVLLSEPLTFLEIGHPEGGTRVIFAANIFFSELWESSPPDGVKPSSEFLDKLNEAQARD